MRIWPSYKIPLPFFSTILPSCCIIPNFWYRNCRHFTPASSHCHLPSVLLRFPFLCIYIYSIFRITTWVKWRHPKLKTITHTMIPFYSSTLSYLLILIRIAFFILLELKLLGYFQSRKGPNKVSIMGIPQPIADALKLFTKGPAAPSNANAAPFLIAPSINLTIALLFWFLLPTASHVLPFKYGLLLFLCLSRLRVYTLLTAGWTSNSKYALLGSLRGVAQTISYEVRIALIFISILLFSSDLNTHSIILSLFYNPIVVKPALFLIWMTTSLAETNRAPFDFVEGERELVSGFNTEYARNPFALIFIAEYLNILFISILTALILTNRLINPIIAFSFLIMKICIISILFIAARATLPRLRYDRLINLTWTSFLPISLIIVIFLTPLI